MNTGQAKDVDGTSQKSVSGNVAPSGQGSSPSRGRLPRYRRVDETSDAIFPGRELTGRAVMSDSGGFLHK